MGRLRMLGVDSDSEIPTPPAGKISIFFNKTELAVKGKLDDGSVLLLTFNAESVQDIVGGFFADSPSIDVVYNDAGNVIATNVIPGGVDHNQLLNFVANKHIDHSAVNITTGTGLNGGGDITATRTINHNINNPSPGTYGSASSVPVVTTDNQGHITGITSTAISILSSAVSDFASSVLSTVLTGLSLATNAAITASDTILSAFGKLQAQINGHFGVGGSTHPIATTSVAGFMSSSDKTKLDGISGTRVIKSGAIAAGDFAGSPKKYTLTFATAFPSANYALVVLGGDVRSWTYESHTAASIVINANANAGLTQPVLWIAISNGESVE